MDQSGIDTWRGAAEEVRFCYGGASPGCRLAAAAKEKGDPIDDGRNSGELFGELGQGASWRGFFIFETEF